VVGDLLVRREVRMLRLVWLGSFYSDCKIQNANAAEGQDFLIIPSCVIDKHYAVHCAHFQGGS
jgi:hypothetical protein